MSAVRFMAARTEAWIGTLPTCAHIEKDCQVEGHLKKVTRSDKRGEKLHKSVTDNGSTAKA